MHGDAVVFNPPRLPDVAPTTHFLAKQTFLYLSTAALRYTTGKTKT